MSVGFDIISDLNLTSQDVFDWEGKPTSLFCIIPGNISSDIMVIYKTLKHLSRFYQGVFFIDGTLENPDINFREKRVDELSRICNSIPNVVYLHTNVVIVDGIALVGINGWAETHPTSDIFELAANRYDDIMYVEKTIERLQLHVDVKKILMISNCIPLIDLYFGDNTTLTTDLFPANVLHTDTEGKITKWVFGASDKMVDTVINGVKYVNNPKYSGLPYYPKRIEV